MAGAVANTNGNSNPCTPPHDAVKGALRQLERDLYLTPDKKPRRQPSRSRSPPPLLDDSDDSDADSATESTASTLVYSPAANSLAQEDQP